LRKSVFAICDDHNAYIGYTSGRTWNGWATPYFTLAEAQRLQADWHGLTYDEVNDEFRIQYDEGEEPYIWKGEDVQTVDGKLHLYGIGAYSHIWDELGDDFRRELARQINEFLYDYDVCSYEEEHEDSDEVIEDIITQFANLDVFVKAYEIMYNNVHGADEIYTKLTELLNI
jgi:hypothetical protein